MNTYADDLAALVDELDLTSMTLIGHSTGGGEVVHYIARRSTERVAKAVLVSAVPPLMVKTDKNPEGVPIDVFDGIRAGVLADRSQYLEDFSAPFYGANRPGSKVSQGIRDLMSTHQAQFNTDLLDFARPQSQAEVAARRESTKSTREDAFRTDERRE